MEVDVSPEELFAVHVWNAAQVAKRKERALVCRVFGLWRRGVAPAEISRRKEEPQPTVGARGGFNERLREELRTLTEERSQIERATAQIQEQLRGHYQPGSHARSAASHRALF
jgi:hypothetical protein